MQTGFTWQDSGLADRRYGKLSADSSSACSGSRCAAARSLLFLDEPTVGMDVESRRQFWSTIRDLAASGQSIC